MSDYLDAPGAPPPHRRQDPRPAGPASDFADFCELDGERRRNSDDDFDPILFDEAVALVLGQLDGGSMLGLPPSSPEGPTVDQP